MSELPSATAELRQRYLYPGEVVASALPIRLATILGSCVAVCLWDPRRRAGGMVHYLMARGRAQGRAGWRFGSLAIPELLAQLRGASSEGARLQAKVFGGATGLALPAGPRSLGHQNVDVARELLAEEGVPIVAEDCGGVRGRKLEFDLTTGDVWVRLL